MTTTHTPKRILLGTDLTARCDRALARAAQLKSQWGAELLVVHALDPAVAGRRESLGASLPSWRRSRRWMDRLGERMRAELEAEKIEAESKVVEGRPGEVMLACQRDWEADLVVLGIAHDDPMDRIQLGSTVDHLVREAAAPVLTVRMRVRGPYEQLVVASDLSACSQPAVNIALRWFGERKLTLFHAFHQPGADDAAPAQLARWGDEAKGRCDDFLRAAAVAEGSGNEWQTLVEMGTPEGLLTDLTAQREVDLVVLGTHGRTGFRRAMLGSTAESLLHLLDCDTLVVRSA